MSSTGPVGGWKTAKGRERAPHGHLDYMKGAVKVSWRAMIQRKFLPPSIDVIPTSKEAISRTTKATGLHSSDKTATASKPSETKQNQDTSNSHPIVSTSNSDTTVVAGSHSEDATKDQVDAGTRQALHHPVTGSSKVVGLEGKVERGFGKAFGSKGMQEKGAQKVAKAERLQRDEARGGGSGAIEGINPAKGT